MASVDEQSTVPPIARSQEDRDDLTAIDRAIERMRAFTPADPYVLTIPQDVEPRYHHSYLYQSKQWLHNTPFQPREHESTQYQTFVYHEPGKEMYMLHNSRHGEAEKGEEKNGIRTGANTPNAQPKKTISLTAYKKKQAGLTPEQGLAKESEAVVKKPAVKGPLERVKADEEVLAVIEGDRELQPSPPKEEEKDLKRKRDDASEKDGKTEQAGRNGHVEEEGRAKKAQRLTPPSSTTEPSRNATKKVDGKQPRSPEHDRSRPAQSKPAAAEPMEFTLPPKLSPPRSAPAESSTEPATKSPHSAIPQLPSRLSSSMSDLMKQTLSARTPRSRSVSKDATTQHRTPPSKSVPRNAFRANSNMASHGDEGSSEDASGGKKVEKASKRHDHSGRSPLGPVVKLKFKSQGEKVKRLLKKPPNPSKLLEGEEAAKKSWPDAQVVKPSTLAKDDVERDSAKRKRSHAEDNGNLDNVPTKRKKSSPDRAEPRKRDEPSTPVPSDQISPPSAPNSRFPITPGGIRKGKDLLPTSMKRDNSNDSRINTPPPMSHSSPSINGTPAATSSNKQQQQEQPSTNGNPKHLAPSVKTPKQQAFEAEQIRLEKLGKELKHAATAHLKPPASSTTHSQPPTPRDQKLAAIKSLESLLAYLLAFTCADAAALSADPKLAPSPRPWKSLHGFLGFVKAHCEPFPALQGLACWLGVVFHSRVLELAARGGVGSLSREAVLDSVAAMGKAGREAEGKLDFDALREKFPRAWEERSREVEAEEELEIASPAGAGEGGKSGRVAFAGPYKLPLGAQSSPLRAARAGYAMLEEWIDGQGGGEELYALKLRL
ncbi:hypothetical protein BDY17DRAFT_59395 [Neohortaea acidophila]|uniref:Uncharacterized protein n=1 Tax=Neohortaea acidophila TaxID=245834 RepID=A0A6A6PFN0_9PEZI|nr:uncharacterized protein BDY17DRAFT_59395 [Neohortaea acidophila]KAF2478788.1 hypothetical protein BDY17DRAFT_59395 [Neohortaea acidophila]